MEIFILFRNRRNGKPKRKLAQRERVYYDPIHSKLSSRSYSRPPPPVLGGASSHSYGSANPISISTLAWPCLARPALLFCFCNRPTDDLPSRQSHQPQRHLRRHRARTHIPPVSLTKVAKRRCVAAHPRGPCTSSSWEMNKPYFHSNITARRYDDLCSKNWM